MSAPQPELAVELHDVHFSYGSTAALRGLSFDVPTGEIVALLGPNGGGKSTTFKILSTQLTLDAGSCRVFGVDPATDPAGVRHNIGVIFQERSLDPKLTVAENLHHQGHLYGLRGADLATRVREGLERFGLTDRAGDRADTLSGGLARRLEVCKGSLHRPRLLLLDEPSTGLDPAARRDLWKMLVELRDLGITVLLTTHLMEEAEGCDRVVILSQGQTVAAATPEELKHELPGDVVELDSPSGRDLVADLATQFGIQASQRGSQLRWESSDGLADIARVAERHRETITRIGLGRATLDDVFFARTGHHLAEDQARPEDDSPPRVATERASGGDVGTVWLGAFSLAQRELKRFFRQRSRIIGTLATPAMFWGLLGTGLGRSFQPPGYGEGGYLEFFYPGMLALTVLFTAIFSTMSIIEDRHLGFLQSVLVAPVSRRAIVLGKIVGGTALGLLQGALLLALAPLAGIALTPLVVLNAAGVLAVMALSLTGLGFALAWKIDSTQGYHSAMNMLLMPMWLLSGSVFPAVGGSAWVSWLMKINPLAYGLAALRRSLGVPAAGTVSTEVGLAVVAAFGVVMFLVSLALVKRPSTGAR